ncbi:hypothetical protein LCGC14_1929420 [marine sediment metagenome]|uniref:Uncharacterized protein n=1 Tax=marine sediment metagenome TaxID=412755 RepID=A0A0F9FNH0_9ZZZZ
MTHTQLEKYFEEKYLKGTCFNSLKELEKDNTLVDVNAPRALIAVNLMGVWRGLQELKNKAVIVEYLDNGNAWAWSSVHLKTTPKEAIKNYLKEHDLLRGFKEKDIKQNSREFYWCDVRAYEIELYF